MLELRPNCECCGRDLAPQSGAETRRTLARRARQLGSDAKDRYEEARERIRRARAQRRQLRDEATGE